MWSEVKGWVKTHKDEILFVCGVTVVVVGTVLVVKNYTTIEKGLEKLLGSGIGGANTGAVSVADRVVQTVNVAPKGTSSVDKVVNVVAKVTKTTDVANADAINLVPEEVGEMMRKAESVGMHLRMLPAGQQASAAKLAEAAERDIELKGIYTLVDGYERLRMAA